MAKKAVASTNELREVRKAQKQHQQQIAWLKQDIRTYALTNGLKLDSFQSLITSYPNDKTDNPPTNSQMHFSHVHRIFD